MKVNANDLASLNILNEALQKAGEPSLDLLSKVINDACSRVPVLART